MTHLTLTPLHHGGYAVRDESHTLRGRIDHTSPNQWSYYNRKGRRILVAATLPALRDDIRRHFAS